MKYYIYFSIFDKTKIDIRSLSYFYNYKLKFINSFNKAKFLKSRIYLILEYKLK